MVDFHWNVFRILADICHTVSKCILIAAIHSNRSAEGVSFITQGLYLLVFLARYLPYPLGLVLDTPDFHVIWNVTLKIFYITSSIYILVLMAKVFARTREKEKAWKMGAAILLGSALLAPVVMLIFRSRAKNKWTFAHMCWIFSIVLESVCVLPQLLLLRQTTVPTVIDSFYLVVLGSYRFFYILNWIVQGAQKMTDPFSDRLGVDPVSVIFGVIQTIFYIDFFWVYWTRQRVKLRGGKVVDGDDLSQSWLVKRFIGQKGRDEDDEEHDGRADAERGQGPGRQGWGPRGISVSADRDLNEFDEAENRDQLTDPRAFEDELDGDEHNDIQRHRT